MSKPWIIVSSAFVVFCAFTCVFGDDGSEGAIINQYLRAGEGTASGMISSREMDPKQPLDASVVQVMNSLNKINSMHVRVFWISGLGTSAHPKLGIGVNQKDLEKFQKDLGANDFDAVLRFVLGHEQAHMKQFEVYPLDILMKKENTEKVEAQADILAGYSAMGTMLMERKPFDHGSDAIKKIFLLAQDIGCLYGDRTTHPSPGTRARLATLGILAQFQAADLVTYEHSHDPKILQRVLNGKKKNADLPDIDPVSFEMERLGKWSKRLAAKITHADDDIPLKP